MAKKAQPKTFRLSANRNRLEEVANDKFTDLQAKNFFKSIVYAAILCWMKDDPRTKEEETILIDSLTALTYVII